MNQRIEFGLQNIETIFKTDFQFVWAQKYVNELGLPISHKFEHAQVKKKHILLYRKEAAILTEILFSICPVAGHPGSNVCFHTIIIVSSL